MMAGAVNAVGLFQGPRAVKTDILSVVQMLWFLCVFISPLFYLLFDMEGSEDPALGKALTYIRISSALIIIGLACRNYDRIRRFGQLAWPLWVYVGFAFVSAAWSEDWFATLREATLLLAYCGAAVAVCSSLPVEISARIVLRFLACIMVISVVVALALPGYGTHPADDVIQLYHAGRWRGVFHHKNLLGATAGVTAALVLIFPELISRRKFVRVIVTLSSLLCLIKSGSTTGIIVTIVLLSVYFLLVKCRRAGVMRTILIGYVAAAVVFTIYALPDVVFGILGRDATLTGRTEIWSVFLDIALESPFIGHGYGYGAVNGANINPILMETVGSDAVDAHNGYLELMLSLGGVGLACLIILIASALTRANNVLPRLCRKEQVGLTVYYMMAVFGVVQSLTEVSPMRVVGAAGPVFWLGLAALLTYSGKRFARR